MKAGLPLAAALLALPLLCSAQPKRLPVFFLRYDGGVGWKEIEPEDSEEERLEEYSQRHRITLRIKEQWSEDFTTNLYTVFSDKQSSLSPGSYSYFYINPDFTWDLTERIRWSAGLRSKWTRYERGSNDLDSLLAKTEFTLRVVDGLKLAPFVQGVFDLYEDPAKTQASYVAGLGLESRLSPAWRLSGRYRSIIRSALGAESTVAGRYNQEFGINLSWDPNK